MSNLRETINELAHDLYEVGIIDKVTLGKLTVKDLPEYQVDANSH